MAKNLTRQSSNLQGNAVWARTAFLGTNVQSKTLGVLGFGRIGKQVAVRMAAFGMKIIAYSRNLTQEEAGKFGVEAVSLDDLYRLSDFITINTPLTDQTKNMFNMEVFKKCKPGVRIVNTARGAIINQNEAIMALDQKLCAGIATDVFDEEPPESVDTWKFIQHEKVIATPHVAAISAESIKEAVINVSEQLVLLIRGQPVSNCVNPSTLNLL